MNETSKYPREGSAGSALLAGSAYAGAQLAPTQPPVNQALAILAKTNAALHEALSELTQRLEPILAPQPPSPVGNEVNRARHSIATQISTEADIAMAACERVRGLTNRLEL